MQIFSRASSSVIGCRMLKSLSISIYSGAKIVIKQKNPYFYPVQNTASTILSAPDTVGKRCPECLYRHMGIPKTPSKDTFHLPVQAVV